MAEGKESTRVPFCCKVLCCCVTEELLDLVASLDQAFRVAAFCRAALGKGEGSYLELFYLELDGLDVGAELQPLELLQLLLRLPQPGADIVQVGIELLPLLEVLFHSQLLAQGLSLYELPSVNHTWQDMTGTA